MTIFSRLLRPSVIFGPNVKTMQKLFFLLVALVVITGCDSGIEGVGAPIEEARIVAPFEVLVVESSVNVNLFNTKRGEEPRVVVHAEANLQPYVITEVKDPKLTVSFEENLRSVSGITVDVYCNNLLKLIHRGSGQITGSQTLKFVRLFVQNEGSGDVILDLRGDKLQVKNDGSGDVELTGKAREARLELGGSGDVNALGFNVRIAEARNEGSGNLSLNARREIEAVLEGSGDIKYLFEGQDDDLDLERDGSGQLVRLTD